MLTSSIAARDFLLADRRDLCSLYWIRLANGKRHFWTNHDKRITYPYAGKPGAHDYVPEGAITISNVRKQAGLEPHTAKISGAFMDSSDDGATAAEIDAGLWDEARVVELIVNWRYPHVEALGQAIYWFGEVSSTDEEYEAEILGVSARMKKATGRRLSRKCDLPLGAAFGAASGVHGCRANVGSQIVTQVQVDASTGDRFIDAVDATLPSTSDSFYRAGSIEWITGENTGLPTQEIKEFTDSGRIIELVERQPFPIADGDRFNIKPSCSRLRSAGPAPGCEFWHGDDWVLYFRGFPHLPSEEELRSPPPRIDT